MALLCLVYDMDVGINWGLFQEHITSEPWLLASDKFLFGSGVIISGVVGLVFLPKSLCSLAYMNLSKFIKGLLLNMSGKLYISLITRHHELLTLSPSLHGINHTIFNIPRTPRAVLQTASQLNN